MWYPILHTDLSTKPLTSGRSMKQILHLLGVISLLSWLRYILQLGHIYPYSLTIPSNPLFRCCGEVIFTENIISQLFLYASLSLLLAFVLALLYLEGAYDTPFFHIVAALLNNKLLVYHSAHRGISLNLCLDCVVMVLFLRQSFIFTCVPLYPVKFVFH